MHFVGVTVGNDVSCPEAFIGKSHALDVSATAQTDDPTQLFIVFSRGISINSLYF